jgi:hypothetical protein
MLIPSRDSLTALDEEYSIYLANFLNPNQSSGNTQTSTSRFINTKQTGHRLVLTIVTTFENVLFYKTDSIA